MPYIFLAFFIVVQSSCLATEFPINVFTFPLIVVVFVIVDVFVVVVVVIVVVFVVVDVAVVVVDDEKYCLKIAWLYSALYFSPLWCCCCCFCR